MLLIWSETYTSSNIPPLSTEWIQSGILNAKLNTTNLYRSPITRSIVCFLQHTRFTYLQTFKAFLNIKFQTKWCLEASWSGPSPLHHIAKQKGQGHPRSAQYRFKPDASVLLLFPTRTFFVHQTPPTVSLNPRNAMLFSSNPSIKSCLSREYRLSPAVRGVNQQSRRNSGAGLG